MLQKSNTRKVLEAFFLEPSKKHYLIEISRKIKLAHTSVKPILSELEKEGIIEKSIEKRGTRKFPEYSSDFNGKPYRKHKKRYNFEAIEDSGLIEYLEEKLTPKCIVLFGSYLRGEDLEDSDVDLFIESKQTALDLKLFENKLGRSIELHFKDDFKKYPDELKNNIINGFVLRGFLKGYDSENNSGHRKGESPKENGRN